jgi:nicotinate-nucleotide adenylyltransferase
VRLGIFGGSFDPIHNGHLALAEACRQAAALDRVLLMPAAQQPHKPHGPLAGPQHRLQMVELATRDYQHLEACDFEIARGGVSYTVDTLRAVAHHYPRAKLYLLMGADTLRDLPNWREPREIVQLATPLAVHRAGEPPVDLTVLAELAPPPVVADTSKHAIDMPLMDISSSDIRRRLAMGDQTVATLLPPAVFDYIQQQRLYQSNALFD